MHIIFSKAAMAYLDPNSGSLLVQLIAAGILGSIGILVKIFWRRIAAFFKAEKYVAPQPDEERGENPNQ
jgi:hypothetical protein